MRWGIQQTTLQNVVDGRLHRSGNVQIENDHRERIAGKHLLDLAGHVADLGGVSGGRWRLRADTQDGVDVGDLDGEVGQPRDVAGA